MDSDSKHVLTILGLVACFGAGYFICKGENRDALALGEKFSVFTRIENNLDGKKKDIDNEKKAIENAVNGYYQTNDKYFDYFVDTEEDKGIGSSELPEFANKYQIIDNIAYINSYNFFLDGIQGFTHYFKDYPTPECDGYIIDLRENIGGLTDYCMATLGNFLEHQIVGEYDYYNGERTQLQTSGTKMANGEKVVILVNENTKSAGEIFTSAMKQFYNDVTIIGMQTYGKGTYQDFLYLSDNEYLKYTAGKYTVGNWQCYDGIGITPDIELAMDYLPEIVCTDNDIQFQTALKLFK